MLVCLLRPISGSLVEDISSVLGARRYPAQPSVLCGWCGYRPHCKGGKAHWGR